MLFSRSTIYMNFFLVNSFSIYKICAEYEQVVLMLPFRNLNLIRVSKKNIAVYSIET